MEKEKIIYYAGGCFWGVEEYFSRLPGVVETAVGYVNSTVDTPTYEEVCRGATGAAEAVQVHYHPKETSLHSLTENFFEVIDPLSWNKQGNDVGSQYRTGIYYTNEEDRETVRAVMERQQERYTKPLAVELLPLENFYRAEEYHQRYLKKNPEGYCHIDFSKLEKKEEAGADGVHGRKEDSAPQYERPPEETLRQRLTPQQYEVTQCAATERPFSGAYWDHYERGIYVDIVTGEPLFSSADKFESGCGWPSFSKPIRADAIKNQMDHRMCRTEVKSGVGNSHLGHVFEDGPRELGGLRYCINSAALRFIPYEQMESKGYGAYRDLV